MLAMLDTRDGMFPRIVFNGSVFVNLKKSLFLACVFWKLNL